MLYEKRCLLLLIQHFDLIWNNKPMKFHILGTCWRNGLENSFTMQLF